MRYKDNKEQQQILDAKTGWAIEPEQTGSIDDKTMVPDLETRKPSTVTTQMIRTGRFAVGYLNAHREVAGAIAGAITILTLAAGALYYTHSYAPRRQQPVASTYRLDSYTEKEAPDDWVNPMWKQMNRQYEKDSRKKSPKKKPRRRENP